MRAFFSILKLAVVVAAVVWLVNDPGEAKIAWRGYEVDTSASALAAIVVLAALGLAALQRLWDFLRDGPRLWSMGRKIRKLREGQRLIEHGLAAIAAGDSAEAGKCAVGARKILGRTAASRLLQAQAAQLAGDDKAARFIFSEMTREGDEDAAVMGYRGLVMAALRDGDINEAERQTDLLRRLRPNAPWLKMARFEISVRRGFWRAAGEALEQARKSRLLEPSRADRHLAATALAEALDAARAGQTEQALQLAEKAAKQSPDWLPAAIVLAKSQIDLGHSRAARRTIERIWPRAPHPALADMYCSACGGEKPIDDCRNLETLVKHSREAAPSRRALAKAALAAGLWGEARRNLLALTAVGEDAARGDYLLLARLEEKESGDAAAAARWTAKAAEAASDPAWLCLSCGGVSAFGWQASCGHCGAFDAIEWKSPGTSSAPLRHSLC